jgi:hypothetical protein
MNISQMLGATMVAGSQAGRGSSGGSEERPRPAPDGKRAARSASARAADPAAPASVPPAGSDPRGRATSAARMCALARAQAQGLGPPHGAAAA